MNRVIWIRVALLIWASWILISGNAIAQDNSPKIPLKIAVRVAPPFIMYNQITGWEGIAIDLWESIARNLDIDFAYCEADLYASLEGIRNGKIDLVISPLTITEQREEWFDFSHQYFHSGLTLAGPKSQDINFGVVMNTLHGALKAGYLKWVSIIFLGIMIPFVALALIDIKQYSKWKDVENANIFRRLIYFFIDGTMRAVGAHRDVFGFRSLPLQIICMLFVLFGYTVAASLFGLIAAALVKSIEVQKPYNIENIDNYRIVTLAKSTGEDYLMTRYNVKCQAADSPSSLSINPESLPALPQCLSSKTNVPENMQRPEIQATAGSADGICETVPSIKAALDKVVAGQDNLALADWAQMAYLARTPVYKDRIYVQDATLKFEPYGWGLPAGSPWREQINRELIGMLRSDQWKVLLRRQQFPL